MPSLRSRLTYANVASSIALFAALTTGGAYAANTIGSSDVIDESLLSQDVKNGEVRNADLGADAVTSSKLSNGTILASDLASNSVTSTKINDGSILTNEIGPNAVNSGKILNNSVTGDDVDESTLGKVGDADTLDGQDASQIGSDGIVEVQQGGNIADLCTVAGQWRECASAQVDVPAGETYRVLIDSDASVKADDVANRVAICSSVRDVSVPFDGSGNTVAGCPNIPTGVIVAAGEMDNLSTNGVQTVSGGASGASYMVSTAVKPYDDTLTFQPGFDFGTIHTLVTVVQHNPSGPPAKPARAARPRR